MRTDGKNISKQIAQAERRDAALNRIERALQRENRQKKSCSPGKIPLRDHTKPYNVGIRGKRVFLQSFLKDHSGDPALNVSNAC